MVRFATDPICGGGEAELAAVTFPALHKSNSLPWPVLQAVIDDWLGSFGPVASGDFADDDWHNNLRTGTLQANNTTDHAAAMRHAIKA